MLKKVREKEILLMIYKEDENEINSLEDEKPDFMLFSFTKKYLFGVEITELFNNESSARLKKNKDYLDKLISTGNHILAFVGIPKPAATPLLVCRVG